MAAPGRYSKMRFGSGELVRQFATQGGAQTFAMAALNTCMAMRFTASDTRDIKSVYINWSTVSSPGQVTVRIETIDATTGKATGTLVDANAVATAVVPTAGWQQVTLGAVPWTSHMVAGTEYAVVVLTTTGGTTQTIRYNGITSGGYGSYPSICLTAADGTTRSNLTEVVGSVPIISFIFDDNVEEPLECFPYATVSTYGAFGNAGIGLKFVVPTGCTFSVWGFEVLPISRVGTPAGDLRCRLLDSSDAVVAGTTVTVDKDSLTGAITRPLQRKYPALVTLTAGTYRLIIDSILSANTSNCWKLTASVARVANNVPSGFNMTTTADVTAGTIVWTNASAEIPPLGLLLDDITSSGSSQAVIIGG